MTNYSPELTQSSESIRQLTEEIYPTVDQSNPEDVNTYDELLRDAQDANEEALVPVIEAHTNQIEQIQVKKIGEQTARAAMEEARLERDIAAAKTINESVTSAYDNYRR